MKKALVTGITRRDVFHLIQLLLAKGYEVHQLTSHPSLPKTEQTDTPCQTDFLKHAYFHLHSIDLTDRLALIHLMKEIQPDELYYLGAISYANALFETPEHISELNALGTLRILNAVYAAGLAHKTRVYQTLAPALNHQFNQLASSDTSAKLNSYQILNWYRASHGIYACNGTLSGYNFFQYSEIPLSERIVTGAVRIVLGLQGVLYLSSLDSRLDWGHGQDYAEGMWRILQQNTPGDFILATSVVTTVREFVRLVFAEVGVDVVFQGEGTSEVGYVVACYDPNFTLMPGQTVIAIDAVHYQAQPVEHPLAEASKVRRQLQWKPRHDLRVLIQEMVKRDLSLFQRYVDLIYTGQHVSLPAYSHCTSS